MRAGYRGYWAAAVEKEQLRERRGKIGGEEEEEEKVEMKKRK